jgi:hypothetical protein
MNIGMLLYYVLLQYFFVSLVLISPPPNHRVFRRYLEYLFGRHVQNVRRMSTLKESMVKVQYEKELQKALLDGST